MIPVHVAVWLALLLQAGSDPATAAPHTSVGRIAGRVFTVARDTLPAPFADLIVMGAHLGTMSDETGAFVISGVPPGRIVLVVRSLGSPKASDTLEVLAGQTTRQDFYLSRPAPSRYEIARDSLEALGRWPPALDAGLLAHMRRARDVRVFRLGAPRDDRGNAPDSAQWIGPWPIVGEAHRPKGHDVADLIDALRVSTYGIPGVKGEPTKLCGGFSPGIDVRFTREGVPVDVLLCYKCNQASIWRGGRWAQSGDFEDARFVEFAKHAVPRDPVLSRVRSLDDGHHR